MNDHAVDIGFVMLVDLNLAEVLSVSWGLVRKNSTLFIFSGRPCYMRIMVGKCSKQQSTVDVELRSSRRVGLHYQFDKSSNQSPPLGPPPCVCTWL